MPPVTLKISRRPALSEVLRWKLPVRVPAIGLTLLKMHELGPNLESKSRRVEVEHHCCGKRAVVAISSIQSRFHKGRNPLCQACSRKASIDKNPPQKKERSTTARDELMRFDWRPTPTGMTRWIGYGEGTGV